MKKILFIALVGFLAVHNAGAEGFSLSSPQIKAKGRVAAEQVFNSFGCQGGNVSFPRFFVRQPVCLMLPAHSYFEH